MKCLVPDGRSFIRANVNPGSALTLPKSPFVDSFRVPDQPSGTSGELRFCRSGIPGVSPACGDTVLLDLGFTAT